MKLNLDVTLSCLTLLLSLLPHICCERPVNCRWGLYGEWSECDGCTKTQVRTRIVEVFAQYQGSPCSGEASQSQECVPKKGCPLGIGCGERFRCSAGQCVSLSLVCNGDQDCEEGGTDERHCDADNSHYVCDLDKTPPNSDHTGKGYDVLTGKFRSGVINTLSFGGQCRKVFSGDHKTFYRLPQSILRYTFQVVVENDFTDEAYESSWSYMKHIQDNALWGHDRRTFHTELNKDKSHRLLIIKNQVELAQFQNTVPQYVTLAEGFWKALSSLPTTYSYPAYRSLLQTYGTHYLSEGALGGQYQALLEFDNEALKETSTTDTEYQRCVTKKKRRLFRKKVKTTCEKLVDSLKTSKEYNNNKLPIKTNVIGGDTSFIAGLSVLDLENPEANGQMYDKWARSVKDFPQVINMKLRPLYELVKEVQCAGLRKLHLKRATEEYLAEEHPCHCRPCHNNGQPLLTGTECKCVCRPGTSGPACESGTVIGEQPGVIHGSWSCWSSWGSCSQSQMSRSRTCTNPAPRRGGLHCVGLPTEHTSCEEPDLQQLQMMEPQCFGLSISPPKACRAPPALRNGFVLSPRDVYLVGSKIEYSCIEGHYITGETVAECTDNNSWTRGPLECKSATCDVPSLENDVTGTPWKVIYQIGDSVSLSCPVGMMREGMAEIICSSSLQWSPSPDSIRCREVPKGPTPPLGLNCKLWETPGKSQCVCKLPYQCQPSLQLCATLHTGRTSKLGMCQLGALQCLGRSFKLVKDSDCDWSDQGLTSCQEECFDTSVQLCVKLPDSAVAVTMSECEVGARRCQGEQFDVVSIKACSAL
ncbi:complement component 7b isoform X2 [Salvelinus sp. IW2-2015]|uniref:complement component 7b isoform X2 n=1 Tax=Salvelinus sp. IW2-2015 TaxID=2691554 RepID=UPI000CDFB0BA|nr:complement component C7 isoform X2 [Salvelinus alpinus]